MLPVCTGELSNQINRITFLFPVKIRNVQFNQNHKLFLSTHEVKQSFQQDQVSPCLLMKKIYNYLNKNMFTPQQQLKIAVGEGNQQRLSNLLVPRLVRSSAHNRNVFEDQKQSKLIQFPRVVVPLYLSQSFRFTISRNLSLLQNSKYLIFQDQMDCSFVYTFAVITTVTVSFTEMISQITISI